jgi:hypothetical protein
MDKHWQDYFEANSLITDHLIDKARVIADTGLDRFSKISLLVAMGAKEQPERDAINNLLICAERQMTQIIESIEQEIKEIKRLKVN